MQRRRDARPRASTAAPDAMASLLPVSASCSRPACQRSPAATLTYDYGSRVATVEHLAPAHPMQYDLCVEHTERLSVPNGWSLVDRRVGSVVDLHGRIAS
jgi:hypothetical protein